MIAYFDCFSGISGDMTLGAIVDAGVPLSELESGLAALSLKGYELKAGRVRRAGFRATKVDVLLKPDVRGRKQEARKWKDIEKIVRTSGLPPEIKKKGLEIFRRLFRAEARVHGRRYDTVHLHELGAIDCIIDIFGSLLGLHILGIKKIFASPVNLGRGFIESEHGRLPVPAPASLELLKGVPVYATDIPFELTTPTGAALISSLADGFVPLPGMKIKTAGVGAGKRNVKKQANVLRLFIGDEIKDVLHSEEDVVVIETNIDDMNPQVYDYVTGKLFGAGALDVFMTQIIMKKGRPAVKLTVLCDKNRKDAMTGIILRETTSIGLRFYRAERKILQREIKQVKTRFGRVRVKESGAGKHKRRRSVEYEDCKKIAEKFDIPLIEVMKVLGG